MRGRGRGFSNYQRSQNNNYVERNDANDGSQSREEFLLMADSTQASFKSEWYVDSGATSHMTCFNDWFVNYVDEGSHSKVILGDDSTQTIKGHGDVQIQLSSGDQGTLKDVLFIPKLARNLLSVGCITDQKMSVEFF